MSTNPITVVPVFPVWLILLLFFFGVAAVLAQHRVIRHKLGHRRALLLSSLRFCAISLLIAFALNPSRVIQKPHETSPAIALLVDTSQSMGQSVTGKDISRLDEARRLLTEGDGSLLGYLKQKYEVNLYGLADSLKPLVPEDLDSLKAGGDKGNLTDALQVLGKRHAVTVLFSDGNVVWDENPEKIPPTITVPFGNPETHQDVLLTGIKAPAFAFRDRAFVVDVFIKNYGFPGLTFPVLLKDSEALLATENVSFETTPGEATVSLSFMPKALGQTQLSISVPVQFGETNVANNQINLSVKVVRDKTRILMVSGTPSMNYRFMRTALKSDPSTDLLSFVILRTPSDILNVRPHEQSLIPFPVETLFSKQIDDFDLVIFDNFNYPIYLRPDDLESLRNFVKAGGSFAVIGGPDLFNEGGYGLSPIEDLLPFRFVEKEIYQRDSPIGVRLSRLGADHPIVRLSEENDPDGVRFWQEIPPVDGINPVEAKRSSTVLLESAEGFPRPILTVSEYGKGRVLALTTDYAWKWYMGMVAMGKGNRDYLRLVHRMVRWLTKDPTLDPIQVILPETAASAGREIDVRVQLRGEDFSKRSDSAISISVFDPAGAEIDSKIKPLPRPGEHLVSFLPGKGGIYRIAVESPAGYREEAMVVGGPFESLDAAPNHEQLEQIAALTAGKYVTPGDDLLKEIENFAQKGKKIFVEEQLLPMWATPLVMAIILSLLASEWYLRRRWGLI